MRTIFLIGLLVLAGCGGSYYESSYEYSPPQRSYNAPNNTWYVDTKTGQPYIPFGDNMINPSTGDIYYDYPNNWKVNPQGNTYKPFGNWYIDNDGNVLVPLR